MEPLSRMVERALTRRRMIEIEHYVRRLAARRVPVPRIVRLTGLPINAVEAILRGAPWRHLAAPRAIRDLFSEGSSETKAASMSGRHAHPSGAPRRASQKRTRPAALECTPF
jgi:hypothetical protein